MTGPITSNTLGVNVFTAPGKTMVSERPKPYREPLGPDPIRVDFNLRRVRRGAGGRNDDGGAGQGSGGLVLPCTIATVETIYITHAHFDHFYGLSILLDPNPSRFPTRAIPNAQDGERHADVFPLPSGAG